MNIKLDENLPLRLASVESWRFFKKKALASGPAVCCRDGMKVRQSSRAGYSLSERQMDTTLRSFMPNSARLRSPSVSP